MWTWKLKFCPSYEFPTALSIVVVKIESDLMSLFTLQCVVFVSQFVLIRPYPARFPHILVTTQEPATTAATSASKDEPEVQTNDDQEISTTSSRDTTTKSPGLCSMVLPVWSSSNDDPSREVLVYAQLDSMSDTRS